MAGRSVSRRVVLCGTIGATSLLSGSGFVAAGTERAAPALAWTRSYPDRERKYRHELNTFQETSDGGYVLGGKGAPLNPDGPERTQFSCLKADEQGDPTWVQFGLDDHELPLDAATAVLQTADGGYVLAGRGAYDETYEREKRDETIARALKFTRNGELAWATAFDQFASDSDEIHAVDASTSFRALTHSLDEGGPLAVGDHRQNGWAVKFTANGSVDWQIEHGDSFYVSQAFTTPNGYRLFAIQQDERVVLHVGPSGEIERVVPLQIDYDTIPHNHVVTLTSDGGYAITGRHDGRQRMALQKFDSDGTVEWLETYNGPYDGYDWAFDLVQTADDGFALFGRMDAAYSGDNTPAIVKTDAAGTEEWQTLLEGDFHRYDHGVQTSDGGYAAFSGGTDNLLAKYEGGDPDGDGTSENAEGADATSVANPDGDDATENASTTANADSDEDGRAESTSATDASGASGEGATEADDDPQHEESSNASGQSSDAAQTDDATVGAADADSLPGFGLGATVAGVTGAIGYRLMRVVSSDPDDSVAIDEDTG